MNLRWLLWGLPSTLPNMPDKQTGARIFISDNHPWLVLSVCVLGMVIFDEQTRILLQYHRQSLLDGQVYRLLTTHIVHTNVYHALINFTALVIIGVLSSRHMRPKDWWVGLAISGLFVSTCLIMLEPQLQWYRGLSGVLHGIVVILILGARQVAGAIRGIFFIGLVLKLILEQAGVVLMPGDQLLGAPVVINAHLYGAMGGVLAYLVLQMTRSRRMFREHF